MEPDRHNVRKRPLVPKEKVLLPPHHIKLGVFKQFVKALKLEGNNSQFSGFLGKHHAENHRDVVSTLIRTYKNFGCNMFLRVHFLNSHMDFFHERLSNVSDEHGEQDITAIEKRYKERWSQNMLADYCWKLVRDHPEEQHKRNAAKRAKCE